MFKKQYFVMYDTYEAIVKNVYFLSFFLDRILKIMLTLSFINAYEENGFDKYYVLS